MADDTSPPMGAAEQVTRPTGEANRVSDADLLAATRAGDAAAYEELFRRHRTSALGLAARYTTQPADREDIVAQAFTDIWQTIVNGRGPVDAFRPYLLTVVRRLGGAHATSKVRRTEPLGDEAMELPDLSARTQEDRADATMILAAFQQLPERWRLVLWHSVVEGEDAARVGGYLGLNANSTYATVHRAKEALRVAYLAQHLSTEGGATCGMDRELLAGFVRGRLSPRAASKVTDHLATCPQCHAKLAELRTVDIAMRSVVAPAVLGIPVAAYHEGVRSVSGGLWAWVQGHVPALVGAGAAAVAAVVGLVLFLPDAAPPPQTNAAPPAVSGTGAPAGPPATLPRAGASGSSGGETGEAAASDLDPSATPSPAATGGQTPTAMPSATRASNGLSSLEQSAVANVYPGETGVLTLQTELGQLGTLEITLPDQVEVATTNLGTVCQVIGARTISCDAPAAPMTYDLPVRVLADTPPGAQLSGGTAVTRIDGQVAAGPIAVAITVPSDPC